MMRLEVLGCSGSQPGAGQACSGYLVSSGATRVLVDCGFGVASHLTGVVEPATLDAIVVTHRHLDHSIDLLGLFRALWAGDDEVPVFAADEVAEALAPMVKEARRPDWERVFPWTTVGPGDAWTVGELDFAALRADHPVPTVSIRITDPDGAVLAFSSDSGEEGDLAACARNADLFLCEATWQGSDQDADRDRRGDGHLTATASGRVAAEAGVRRLVLTHLRPHLDPAVSVAEAAAVFGGPVDVARDGAVHLVSARTGDGRE